MKSEIALLRVVAEKLFEGCMIVDNTFAYSDKLLRIIDKIKELEERQAWIETLEKPVIELPESELNIDSRSDEEWFWDQVAERKSELKIRDLTGEEWREYVTLGTPNVYRIINPVTLYIDSTTHRVLDDDGIMHCIPMNGTVLRWKPRDPEAF